MCASFVRCLGSTWLLLLAATMLTFHRPNDDLTFKVIPDDLLENKSLKKRKKEKTTNTRTHTNIRTNVHTSQKSFPQTIHCIVLAKGGKCKICSKLGSCAASSEVCVGDVPMFWVKMEERRKGGNQHRGEMRSFGTTFNFHVVTASYQTLREQWLGQRNPLM